MKIKAAVTAEKGGRFLMREIDLADPRPDELIVRLVATGICHSDIGARDQVVPIPLPIVLGHEGAGVVVATGANVRKLAVGDHVILTRMACGTCVNCIEGRSSVCHHAIALNLSGGRLDGTSALSDGGAPVHSHFIGQSSFATYALASERNATKVDPDLDLKIAPAFACGVLTGAGAVLKGLRVEAGDSLAVFGAGAVGLAAAMAAKLAGCTRIVVVDRVAARLDLALELAATDAIVATPGMDLAAAVRAVVPGGVTNSVEATGAASVVRAAVDCLAPLGVCALLGVGDAAQEITLNHMSMALAGTSVRGFPSGGCEPDALIPRLIELYRAGRFPVDRLVAHFHFDEIERAVASSERGDSIKPILVFDS